MKKLLIVLIVMVLISCQSTGTKDAMRAKRMKNCTNLTADEIEWIKNEKIQRGMSECALIASWGEPYFINRSTGSWGVHKRYVYQRGGPWNKSIYVFVENGVVDRWHD
ncbi:MAG: hypothetical protein OEM06_07005 [Desulfobacteraceae bacterium]|nr:hypothetical protein [Desulfobacteraceae bacterium]